LAIENRATLTNVKSDRIKTAQGIGYDIKNIWVLCVKYRNSPVYNEAVEKQRIVKASATKLNQSKKRKRFFLFKLSRHVT
jgi:hypothetical protein